MAKAIHITNPFSKKIETIFDFEKDETVLDVAAKLYGDGNVDFVVPTICIVGDKPLLRKEWGSYVPEDSEVVSFVAVTGADWVIYVIIAVVVSIAVSLLMVVTPPKMGSIPEPDPVFTLRGQTNKVKLGDPIEDHYGRVRIFPSYAAISYNKYIDNEQYLYSLFCLGQGEFEIENVFVEDTNINNFDDAEYVIYGPGETVDLFRDNVETSNEVAGIEMFGPNEPEYDSWIGPFAAGGPQSSSDIIEVDVVIPQGLSFSNDEGGLDSRTVTASFQYRQIDQNGAPVGNWLVLSEFSKTLRTVTPQRYTLTKVVPSGRYEVRARRTNNKDTNFRSQNTIKWESLRAFLPNVGNYGDVTLLAIRARASNNFNDSSRSQINLFATRKLPIWNGVQWSNPVATRSAVWAMANIFRSIYGGNITEDKFFDLDDFLLKDQQLNAEGRTFDWTFDTRGTVWEDAAMVCRAVRGRPLLRGSIITIALERSKTIPTAVFGPNNIVSGSLEWDIKIYNQNEYDGIEAEYVDPITWKSEVLVCALPDSGADYLEPMKFPGITNRDIAFREGMYEESKRRYNRENVTFSTGLEGHIPTWGDLILVQHDLPKWGQGGRLLALQGLVLQLDSEVTFTTGEVHQVVLKDKTGAASGPHIVTEVLGDPYKVQLQSSIDLSVFDFSETHERPIFAFGVQNLEGKLLTVLDVSTNGEEEISITGVNYDSRVFYYDTQSPAPPLPGPSVIDSWSLPKVNGLGYSLSNDASRVTILWNAIRSARLFIVQWSDNLTTYIDSVEVTDNTLTLDVPYTPMYIRVAAVTDLGQGPWSGVTLSQSATEAAVPVLPSNVNVVSGYGSLQVYWDTQGGADFYEISAKPFANDTPSADATSEINNYLLVGLGPNELIYFRVRAVKTLTTGTLLYSAWSTTVGGTTNVIIGQNYYGPTEPPNPGGTAAEGAIWFDTDDGNRMYRWDGTVWVDVQKVLAADDFGLGIRPIQIVSALPTLPDGDYPVGAQVTLSSDNYRLYRNDNDAWDYSVKTEQIDTSAITTIKIADNAITNIKIIDGAVVAGKIATNAVVGANIVNGAIVAGKLGVGAVGSGNIADSAVVAGKIADDAVVAANIVDGEIVAGKLGDSAVTAGSIATDAVTADKILANSITAAKISTDAVTADKIEANAVTAVKIEANAVTADKIEANAVTAVKINTDAVTADKIAANSVTTSKLLVSGRGAALNADPGCQDSSAWVRYPSSLSDATFTTITDGLVGNNVIRGSNRAWYNGADRLPFDPNKTYRVRAVARRSSATANGTCYIGVALFDSSGNGIGGDGTQWFYVGGGGFLPGEDFTLRSGEFGFDTTKTFPANARTMAPLIILSYNGTIGYMEAQDLRIEEKINGELIVDGAITADKIAANAVTADSIAANAVTASKIVAGSISATKLTLGGTVNIVGTSNMTDEEYWTLLQGVDFTFITPTSPIIWNSERLAKLGGSYEPIIVSVGRPFEVEEGSSIRGRYKVYVNAGTLGYAWIDIQFSQFADFSGPYAYAGFGDTLVPLNSVKQVDGKITVPAGYRYARARLVKYNGGPLVAYFGDVVIQRAVDTALIVDGAISADKILANSITADKILANSITADKILAGSITASKLTLGGTTGNIVGTSNMTDEDYWTLSQGGPYSFEGLSAADKITWNSTNVVRLGDSANLIVVNGKAFEVEPGDVISGRYKVYIAAGTAGVAYMDIMYSQYEDFTGTLTWGYFDNGYVPTGAIKSLELKSTPVPDGYRFAKIRMVKSSNGPTRVYFGDTYFKKAVGTALIVDGAIVAGSISAGAITADAVGTNEIIADIANISQGVIDQLIVTSISAGDITTGTIDTAVLTLSGTGGVIKSEDFDATALTGFRIQGNGNAQFNDVVMNNGVFHGRIEASQIVVDDNVWLYRSDALTKPAAPSILTSVSNAANNTVVGFLSWNALGSNTSNRMIKSPIQLQVSVNLSGSRSSGGIYRTAYMYVQQQINGGSWTTVETVQLTDSGGSESYDYFAGTSISVFSVNLTASGSVNYRVNTYRVDSATSSIAVLGSNW